MLEHERPTFLGVTARRAALVDREAFDELLLVHGSVRVVARGALHRAIANRHMGRTLNLRHLVYVALGTRIRLCHLDQLAMLRHWIVDAVATRTGNVAAFVPAASPKSVIAIGVAAGAGLVAFGRASFRERDHQVGIS
jgi:hypothetical protein